MRCRSCRWIGSEGRQEGNGALTPVRNSLFHQQQQAQDPPAWRRCHGDGHPGKLRHVACGVHPHSGESGVLGRQGHHRRQQASPLAGHVPCLMGCPSASSDEAGATTPHSSANHAPEPSGARRRLSPRHLQVHQRGELLAPEDVAVLQVTGEVGPRDADLDS